MTSRDNVEEEKKIISKPKVHWNEQKLKSILLTEKDTEASLRGEMSKICEKQ